jgi:hypothetical protein
MLLSLMLMLHSLSCPVWIDCHVHMSGFRTDSSIYHTVVAKHTLVFGMETCNYYHYYFSLLACRARKNHNME